MDLNKSINLYQSMRDWSKLPDDILSSICKRIRIAIDYVQFSAVCKSWRSVATDDSNRLLPQPPWLMLADEFEEDTEANPSTLHRGFVGLSQPDKVYYIELPEAHQKNCIGSTGNRLITVGTDNIRLLNPFSRVEFHLPNQFTFMHPPDIYEEDDENMRTRMCRNNFISKVVLSSHNPRDCIVMAFYSDAKLAFARPGGASWITIECATYHRPLDDVIFFKDRFYAISTFGIIFVCDINTADLTPVIDSLIQQKDNPDNNYYLVECLGELLVVFKSIVYFYDGDEEDFSSFNENPFYKTRYFVVFKIDLDTKDKQVVNNLGQRSLFLGRNTSVCVLAFFSLGLRKNCIYFTDDIIEGFLGTNTKGGHDMGIFDLEEQIIRPHYPRFSTHYYSPPIWIIRKSIMDCPL